MRNFFLGVAATLVMTMLGATALVLSLRSDSPSVAPSGLWSTGASSSPSPRPSTVAQGETWLGTVDFTSSDVLTDGGDLTDVTAIGHGVTVSDGGIRAQHLDLEVTLSWKAAAAQIGDGVEVYAVGSGRAGLSRTLDVLGQKIPVKATGVVRAEHGLLVIEPQQIDLQGPDWLDSVASAAARTLLTIRQPIQGVPKGLALQKVTVVDTGFRAQLTGTDVTLTT